MGGYSVIASLQLLAFFSVWTLLVLLAVWRISVRAVEAARRDAIAIERQREVLIANRKRAAAKKTVTE